MMSIKSFRIFLNLSAIKRNVCSEFAFPLVGHPLLIEIISLFLVVQCYTR
jgi:hypothetical protein